MIYRKASLYFGPKAVYSKRVISKFDELSFLSIEIIESDHKIYICFSFVPYFDTIQHDYYLHMPRSVQ